MTPDALGRSLGLRGYCHLDAEEVASAIGADALTDWTAFARTWDRLELDRHMADGGSYRRRRYACYAVHDDRVERLAHRPHYQTMAANPLNGGIDRWFAPVDQVTGRHPALQGLMRLCAHTFAVAAGAPAAAQPWLVEAHQFRIEASAHVPGLPTPEGVHRDGVDWVFVCLVGGANIDGGVTTIHAPDGRSLDKFTLKTPLEAVFLDDHRLRHGVTPVRVRCPGAPAHRDVLVLTYRASEACARPAGTSLSEGLILASPA